MLKRFSLLFALAGIISITSCETDFTLNGEYQITPIVFGLMDQEDYIHYVKITKTYLGDGNNYTFAQVADSNYFNSVDARIIEFDDNGDSTGVSWQLHDTIIPNKDAGTFYGPEQKVYVFYSNDLDSSKTYKLVADLNEGEYSIDAETQLIKGFKYAANIENGTLRFPFGSATSTENNNYNTFISSYSQGLHGALYNTTLYINYRETYADGTSSDFSIPWSIGNETQDNPEAPESATLNFSGEEFYTKLRDNIAKITTDGNVTKRQLLGLDITTAIADADLAQYMEISEPSSSITQATPQYTNINCETGALGLFASRNIVTITGLQINSGSMVELCTGQHTVELGFCSHFPEHSGEAFYCD